MCPFCNHYKPKLEVNIVKSLWHCWVCDKKGRSLFTLLKGMKATKSQFDELSGLVGDRPRQIQKDDKSIVIDELVEEAGEDVEVPASPLDDPMPPLAGIGIPEPGMLSMLFILTLLNLRLRYRTS